MVVIIITHDIPTRLHRALAALFIGACALVSLPGARWHVTTCLPISVNCTVVTCY